MKHLDQDYYSHTHKTKTETKVSIKTQDQVKLGFTILNKISRRKLNLKFYNGMYLCTFLKVAVRLNTVG